MWSIALSTCWPSKGHSIVVPASKTKHCQHIVPKGCAVQGAHAPCSVGTATLACGRETVFLIHIQMQYLDRRFLHVNHWTGLEWDGVVECVISWSWNPTRVSSLSVSLLSVSSLSVSLLSVSSLSVSLLSVSSLSVSLLSVSSLSVSSLSVSSLSVSSLSVSSLSVSSLSVSSLSFTGPNQICSSCGGCDRWWLCYCELQQVLGEISRPVPPSVLICHW